MKLISIPALDRALRIGDGALYWTGRVTATALDISLYVGLGCLAFMAVMNPDFQKAGQSIARGSGAVVAHAANWVQALPPVAGAVVVFVCVAAIIRLAYGALQR